MMASLRRTIIRGIKRNPDKWRGVTFNKGENRVERRRRAKQQKGDHGKKKLKK
jgi:hypothetical protein